MAPLIVPVYYDFASTIAYVAHRVMGDLAAPLGELDVELEWRPLDLAALAGWTRGAPMPAEARDNAARVARELGVAATPPPRWIDSRAAHAVALALGDTPRGATWRERVWTAAFEERRALDAEVVAALAQDLDLELPQLDGDAVAAATEAARALGVNGVPTFLLDRWPMGGIQEPATMLRMLERFARRQREAAAPR
jgi:predicted DsbA family dithiol-disulfide isomerase